MGQSRPLFSLCLSFSHDINQCESIDGVLVTWTQGRQDGRRRRIHWAMAAPLNIFSWPLKDVVRLLGRPLLSTPSSVRIPSTDIFPTFVMSRKFRKQVWTNSTTVSQSNLMDVVGKYDPRQSKQTILHKCKINRTKNCPNSFKVLPKWRNCAKSGHTAHYSFYGPIGGFHR